ncbi:MAG: MerR family transcriptional regulator [Aeromicrobium sp.]
MPDYRIDDLARAVGVTVRNIRAYQDRGLLSPPRILGRVGIYSDAHAARLRHIKALLQRGYASPQIHELFGAWEQGKDLGAFIGLEKAVNDPWSDEVPVALPTDELHERLSSATEDYFDRFTALGWIKPAGVSSVVVSPRLLDAFKETVGFGFSEGEIVELYESIVPEIDNVARSIVDTAEHHLIAKHGAAWVPSDKEAQELAAMLVRLRQLTVTTIQAALAKAMESTMEAAVAKHLERIAVRRSEEPIPDTGS